MALKDELLNELRESNVNAVARVERQLLALENMQVRVYLHSTLLCVFLQGPIRTNLLCASVFCSYASHLDLLHCFADISRHFSVRRRDSGDKHDRNLQSPFTGVYVA